MNSCYLFICLYEYNYHYYYLKPESDKIFRNVDNAEIEVDSFLLLSIIIIF